MGPPRFWALAALLAVACVSDHDGLARRDRGAGGTAGSGAAGAGAGGTAGTAGGTGLEGGLVDGSAGEGGTIGTPGTDRLSLVHGVVDAERVSFCFGRARDGRVAEPVGNPFPSQPLAYAGVHVVDTFYDLDPATDDLAVAVIAGELDRIAGSSCIEALELVDSLSTAGGADAGSDAADASSDAADASSDAADASSDAADASSDAADASSDAADAAPPPLRAAWLPVIPAGSLDGGRSVVLIASGCMGGPTFTVPYEWGLCGRDYTPSHPTLTAVLVAMSRQTRADRLGLQVVNAARAADPIDLVAGPPEAGLEPPVSVARNVAFGAIVPRPPNLTTPKAGYGVPLGQALIGVSPAGSTVQTLSIPWSDVLANAGLDDGDVANGDTLTLVLVGPRPGMGAAPWSNPTTVTVVSPGPP